MSDSAKVSVGALLCLILGLYLPTSAGGIPTREGPAWIMCAGVIMLFLSDRRFRADRLVLSAIATLPAWVAFCSFFSGFADVNFKFTIPGFILLGLVLCLRLKQAQLRPWLKRLFLWTNLINIVLGFSMLAGVERVNAFITSYYSYIDRDFVSERMLSLNKPVLTFYVHSVAGFMMYTLLYANLRAFESERKKIFLAIAACYLLLIGALLSVTGMSLFILGAGHITYVLWKQRPKLVLIGVTAVAIAIPLFFSAEWNVVKDITGVALANSDSGLIGRYSYGGTMHYSLEYALDHPLQPIGASNRAEMFLGDSGLLLYFVRGSFPLLIGVYAAYFFFLKGSLRAKKDILFLFVLTVAFEFGVPILLYQRFIWLLPFLCCYLNSLPAEPAPVLLARRV